MSLLCCCTCEKTSVRNMFCLYADIAALSLMNSAPGCRLRPPCVRPATSPRQHNRYRKHKLISSESRGSNKISKKQKLTCCHTSRSVEAPLPQEASTTIESEWSAFCDNVSGEWEGATVTFTADGQPQELPSQYVPKEFRDWDVTLYDWQSQCSMQPLSTGIKCLLKRLMPTVGCEADAQSFEEDKRQLLGSSKAATQHAILSNGSYTTASSLDLSGQTSLRFEHCLVTVQQRRIRVVQHVKASGTSDSWQLSTVEVHNEKYDAPYNGGAELSGCGGGMSNFAETSRLDASQLQQDWAATSGRSYSVSQAGTLQSQDLPSRYC